MNGATEATLAELLRVAQDQNANLASLNQLLAGRSSGGGGGGGGGIADMAKNIPLVNIAFSVLGAAASVVGSAFEILGNVVGKVVEGIGATIKGLAGFAQKTMDGTARMSDLFDAFSRLPFFLGELMSIGAGLLRILEKLTDEYIMMSKVGAGFTGGLREMRSAAQSLAIGFTDLASMTSKNSEILSQSGGTVSNGFKKFVSGMEQLMGQHSPFRDSMFALGVNSKEAGEAMLTMMKLQQVGVKNGQIDSATLGKQTKEYIENLDQLSRLTGIHRDQLNESMKKQADDQIFQNFLDNLGDDKKKAAINDALAASLAQTNQDYVDNYLKPALMLGVGAINDAGVKIGQATGGTSMLIARQFKDIMDSNMDSKQKVVEIMKLNAENGVAAKKFASSMGDLAGINGNLVNQTLVKLGRQVGENVDDYLVRARKEREAAEASRGANVKLMKAQEDMVRLGNSITMALASVALELAPTLIGVGMWILDAIKTAVVWISNHSKEIGAVWDAVVFIFEEYVIPKLTKIADWFVETWKQLEVAWGKDGPHEIITVLKDRLADGMKNIWEDMQAIWALVSPGLIKIWNNDIKPVLISMFEGLFKSMMDAIKDYLFGPKTDTSTPAGKQRATDINEKADYNFSQMKWYEKASTGIAIGLEKIASVVAPDFADRARNQRILSDSEILKERQNAQFQVQGKASGGIVNPGTYLVGEKGPELLSVGSRGNVITNENLQQLMARMASNSDNKDLVTLLEALNNTMNQIVYYSRDTAEYTRRTAGEISGLNSNILPQV
jgi:hypothetical protein